MALADGEILAQNPWWTEEVWRASDPQLALLDSQPMRLPADFVAGLDLSRGGIHILRGPRQVGKSTDLKLLVERALQSGRDPRSVIYLTLDLLEGRPHAELAETVLRAKALARHDGPGGVLPAEA